MLHSQAVATEDQPGDQVDEGKPRSRFRLGKKWGLRLRVAIYVPLLVFFGWRALERFQAGSEAADQNFRNQVQNRLASPPDVIMLPNGEAMRVISEDQAEALGVELSPAAQPTAQPTQP